MNYSEKGVTIRPPSTANLMIDSADRNAGTWGNFTISRPQSLFNGFFTRLGVTEVVLEWGEPNVNLADSIIITVDGTDYEFGGTPEFYTVAELLDVLVAFLKNENIPNIGTSWEIDTTQNVVLRNTNNYDFIIGDTPLARKLFGSPLPTPPTDAWPVLNPDLRPYRYIDIVSTQLTYNQDLKDASTALKVRDVLCRWYFCWDNPPQLDAYGFPILMGYTPFYVRRIFNPPKQIKWDSIQPLGQISFEVYDNAGDLIKTADANNFLMTIQASEN